MGLPRFIYATLLREPVARFVSEYLHTLRGATWLSERLPCPKAHQLRNQYACWNSTTIARLLRRCSFWSLVLFRYQLDGFHGVSIQFSDQSSNTNAVLAYEFLSPVSELFRSGRLGDGEAKS